MKNPVARTVRQRRAAAKRRVDQILGMLGSPGALQAKVYFSGKKKPAQ